jgi:Ser/Thr protein kinase RdoA (MazF antagonist)
MIEWPPGHHHPLAVMDFVPGRPLRVTSPEAPAILGKVCGMVQARLAQVGPNELGLEDRGEEWLDYLISTEQDLGDFAWLHEVNATLAARASGAAASLRRSCGVWDGPDVLMETGTPGLVDFGHVAYQPTINFVANRLVACALGGEQRRARFLVAFSRELTLPKQDLEWLPLFELVNVAIYAKFAAWRLQNKPDGGIPPDQARQSVERMARYLIQ